MRSTFKLIWYLNFSKLKNKSVNCCTDFREGNGEIQEVIEQRYERTGSGIRIRSNKKYEFWIESVDQSDRVKSESKVIDTSKCAVNP